MFALLKRFFTDENYFTQTLAGLAGNSKLRGILIALAIAAVGGQIPLGPLGPYVYWLAPLLGLGAGAIAHGDSNAPLVDRITKIEARLP